MTARLFDSELWKPALEKFGEATGLTVRLFDAAGGEVPTAFHATPLAGLLAEFGTEPGLFDECAQRCLSQKEARPAVSVAEEHGLAVVGTSLCLEGRIVGAAVGGYALAGFSQVAAVQRWARAAGLPFDRLWEVVRRQPPMPERRLKLQGELLQVLGDALLRENHRTRQYQDVVEQLNVAAAAKDEFLAVLSHELRTPLAAIQGWASVLKKDDRPEQVSRATSAIERNVSAQSRMVEDLLDVSRIARGTVELELAVHDLSVLVGAAVEMSVPGIEQRKLSLEFVDAAEPLFVDGDAGRLQQVFRNIIGNAVKFTPAGGTIRVVLRQEADAASVIVTDSGAGIAPAFVPFVFDMFRQQEEGTRREFGGLGIGLALVKRLTELHRGTVSVTSAGTGKGTEVVVRLPLALQTLSAHESETADQAPSSTLVDVSILVVEDTKDSRESLQLLLELLGAKVRIARDGREALDMIERERPDLILCDLRMPRMDGFEFMRELNRRGAPVHPPVVAMSGLAGESDRKRAMNAGFDSQINKPFSTNDVLRAVGAVLHRPAPAGFGGAKAPPR